jgi:hypothetical protein
VSGLATLRQQVGDALEELQPQLVKHTEVLLQSANALPDEDTNKQWAELAKQAYYFSPRTIDECIRLALKGCRKSWKKLCPYSSPSEMQKNTLTYLAIALEVRHWSRLHKQIKACIDLPNDPDLKRAAVEVMTTQHTYLPSTETLPLMISEYYADTRLRTNPDQAGLIHSLVQPRVTNDRHIGAISQAIMGSGKSKIIGPCQLQIMLGAGKIPFYCVPNPLFQTSISDYQNMMWTRYRTHVRAFMFDRDSCTAERLHVIAENLMLAQTKHTVFVTRPRDLHSFQLMLKERHQLIEDMRSRLNKFVLQWGESALDRVSYTQFAKSILDQKWKNAREIVSEQCKTQFTRWFEAHQRLEQELKLLFKEADLIQANLNLLQLNASVLLDEVASVLDPRNQLSFPIGWQEPANSNAIKVACRLYFEWLPDFYSRLGILENMQSLSAPATRVEVYEHLASRGFSEYAEYLDRKVTFGSFKAYLFSDEVNGQPMKQVVDQMNASVSLLTRNAAQEIAFLKFCLTSGLEGCLTATAHVNYGRSKQDPSLQLAIPYERANLPKENTLYRLPWKTALMTCQLYSQVWNDNKQTAELVCFIQGVDPASKDASILEAAQGIWGRSHLDCDINNNEQVSKLRVALDKGRTDPKKAPFARLLISTYLQQCVFPLQLRLDPAQLTSTPHDLSMVASKTDGMGGTFGFERTWNPNFRRIPDPSSDERILAALGETKNQRCRVLRSGGAEALFSYLSRKNYIALIDTGAHFKGIANEDVAQRLLLLLPDFDSILFYDDSCPSGAKLAIMTKKGKAIFDHSDSEGVRRGLRQLKVTRPFTYYDQARCIGADIELPDGVALTTFSDKVTQDDLMQGVMRARKLLDGRHTIEYAIPGEMGAEWTAEKVIATAKEQQIRLEQKSNYHAICEQMRGHVRACIDKAMRSNPNAKSRHKLYRKCMPLLLEKQNNDLVEAFGGLQPIITTELALSKMIHHFTAFIEQVLPASKDEVNQALNRILEWHKSRGTVLPQTVREGEEHEEATQEVDLSKDQDRMRMMEEEYERMLGTREPKAEVEWKKFVRERVVPIKMGMTGPYKSMPALYTLSSALVERGFNVPFGDNILVSRNLMETFQGETNCLLTVNQKPFHRCLFIDGANPKLVILTEEEAKSLKKHFEQFSEANKDIYIVEPSGIINMRADKSQDIYNLWEQRTSTERMLLLQALLFQGGALTIDKLDQGQVREAIAALTGNDPENLLQCRNLFERAMEWRDHDLAAYQKSRSLKALFRFS